MANSLSNTKSLTGKSGTNGGADFVAQNITLIYPNETLVKKEEKSVSEILGAVFGFYGAGADCGGGGVVCNGVFGRKRRLRRPGDYLGNRRVERRYWGNSGKPRRKSD